MSLNCSHLVVTLLFIFAADAVNCVFRPLEGIDSDYELLVVKIGNDYEYFEVMK